MTQILDNDWDFDGDSYEEMAWSTKQVGMKRTTKLDRETNAYYTEIATVTMDIEVDWNALAQYFAAKLAKSKGKVSRIQGDAIVATARKVERKRA
jgi:hypothetical protein